MLFSLGSFRVDAVPSSVFSYNFPDSAVKAEHERTFFSISRAVP
jgi:hypothetical protein